MTSLLKVPIAMTKYIENLDKLLSEIKCTRDEIQKVEVLPIGKTGMCYLNCYDFAYKDPEFEVEVGWAIWVCEDNKDNKDNCSWELQHHAILLHKETKTYIDITKPEYGEKQIWWVKDKNNKTNSFLDIIIKISEDKWVPIPSRYIGLTTMKT